MDITPLLTLLKGKNSDSFKLVLEGLKMLNDEQRLQYNELKQDFAAVNEENRLLKNQIEAVIKLEEKCLQRNVDAYDLIRNLSEWIIFEEKRPDIKRNIQHLINGKG